MTPEPEDFDKLLQALKLKRYEKPHPRYFNDFSSQVISRLAKGDRKRDNSLFRLLARWLLSKPVAAGAGATLVAALAITVWVLPRKIELLPSEPVAERPKNQFEAQGTPKAFANFDLSSTNPYAPSSPSLFDLMDQKDTFNVRFITPSISRTN